MQNVLWSIICLIVGVGSVGWILWSWLIASDEPGILLIRWVVAVVVMGFVFINAARARDEFSKIAALLIGCVGGIVMVLVWRQRFCDWVGDMFAGLYSGGRQEIDPAPFYSIANAKRKKGQYDAALLEVQKQLERFPTDFGGWMLLAEIQAEDQKDLAAALGTVETIMQQEGHAPKNLAFAWNRVADWYLKLAHDPEGARMALERIVQLLPETEQSQVALQRIAHLASPELLAERRQPLTVPVPRGEANVGLREGRLDIKPVEEDPAVTAGNYVKH